MLEILLEPASGKEGPGADTVHQTTRPSLDATMGWLFDDSERTVYGKPASDGRLPLLPGKEAIEYTKGRAERRAAVYRRAKKSERGEFGDDGDPKSDARQQVYFILLFLVGGIAGSFSNNLESIYIGHIRTCADADAFKCLHGHCKSPFANASNITCPQLVNDVRAPCGEEWPAWTKPPKMHHDMHNTELKTVGDACPLSCNLCRTSKANENAPAQLAAYSLIESFLGWFGGLGSLWGGLTPKIARCVGVGDEEGAGRLLKMSFICCFFATAVAWGIIYPFGEIIVKGAFAPTAAVLHYSIPFMWVHAAGIFFGYIQSVCEGAISGLQYVTVGTLIGLVRSLYMGISNYFTIIVWDGFGVSGVFGEGCASASRHCVILSSCLAFLFCYSPNRHLRICAGPLQNNRDWKPFLRDGIILMANSYFASVGQFLNPILTSRMKGSVGTLALGARTIVDQVSEYPGLIGGVISQVVIILGEPKLRNLLHPNDYRVPYLAGVEKM